MARKRVIVPKSRKAAEEREERGHRGRVIPVGRGKVSVPASRAARTKRRRHEKM